MKVGPKISGQVASFQLDESKLVGEAGAELMRMMKQDREAFWASNKDGEPSSEVDKQKFPSDAMILRDGVTSFKFGLSDFETMLQVKADELRGRNDVAEPNEPSRDQVEAALSKIRESFAKIGPIAKTLSSAIEKREA